MKNGNIGSYVLSVAILAVGVILVCRAIPFMSNLETVDPMTGQTCVDISSLLIALVLLIIGFVTIVSGIAAYCVQKKFEKVDKIEKELDRARENVILSANIVITYALPHLSETQQISEGYKSLLESTKPLWKDVKWVGELEKTGNASKIWFTKALYLILDNEVKEAIKVLKEKIINTQNAPKNMKRSARYRVGICYRQLEEYQKSIDVFVETGKSHPEYRDLAKVMQGITYFAWAKSIETEKPKKYIEKIKEAYDCFKKSAEKLKTNAMVCANTSKFFFYLWDKKLFSKLEIKKENIIDEILGYTQRFLEVAVLWGETETDISMKANWYECVGNGYYFYGNIYSKNRKYEDHLKAFDNFTKAIKYYQNSKEIVEGAKTSPTIYSEDRDRQIPKNDFINEIDEQIDKTFRKICDEWKKVKEKYQEEKQKLAIKIEELKSEDLPTDFPKKVEEIKEILYKELQKLPLMRIEKDINKMCELLLLEMKEDIKKIFKEKRVKKFLELLREIQEEKELLKEPEKALEVMKENYREIERLKKIEEEFGKNKGLKCYVIVKNVKELLEKIIKAPSECVKRIKKELRDNNDRRI